MTSPQTLFKPVDLKELGNLVISTSSSHGNIEITQVKYGGILVTVNLIGSDGCCRD